MRHLQRMQMGFALAAILLCLTSTAISVKSANSTSVLAAPNRNLASVLQLDSETEGVIEIFRDIAKDKLPVAVLRPSDALYPLFSNAIHHAQFSAKRRFTPDCFIVIYSKTGQSKCVLEASRDGDLYDEITKHAFHGGKGFVDLLRVMTQARM
jgi:hypothetical protein